MRIQSIVHKHDAEQRADRYIRKLCPDIPLSRIYSLFRKKEIKINGKAISKSCVVAAGNLLEIYGLNQGEIIAEQDKSDTNPDSTLIPGENKKTVPLQVPFELNILFENEHLLVIDKSGFMAVHPGTGIKKGASVIEKVRRYLDNVEGDRGESLFKPSPLHRLDKTTSGVLLIAKSGRALRFYSEEWKEKRIHKKYLALVSGKIHTKEGTIVGKLTRINTKGGGEKTKIDNQVGKNSITRYRVYKPLQKFTLLEIFPETGRLHQIRAHLLSAGLKIAGDTRYGDRIINHQLKQKTGLCRSFLHASEIKGRDFNGKNWSFTSALPEDLNNCLKEIMPV
ncbi:MAG: RluA family pseudouridine synthase [Fibrobacteria bacterium]|nr:RluA family pseudouridine synthase [Fibrobacteria bacterium]